MSHLNSTVRHSGPDVSGTISWQQLAGLDHATTILSEVSAPIQHDVMYPESLSEGATPPEEPTFSPPVFDVTSDNNSVSDGDSHVTENNGPSRQSPAPLQAEGVTPAEHPVTAGTSLRGRVHTMSRRMAESIAQASTTWHINTSWAKPMKTCFVTPTLNFKSA